MGGMGIRERGEGGVGKRDGLIRVISPLFLPLYSPLPVGLVLGFWRGGVK
jgi:hypothetical protein